MQNDITMTCPCCATALRTQHVLISTSVPALNNRSDTIEPVCGECGRQIKVADIARAIHPEQHVVLVSGTAGAGKTAVGQYIAHHYSYVLIDGDATSRLVNHHAKHDPSYIRSEYLCHTEVIDTMLVTLGLGYNVIVAYVIQLSDLPRYSNALALYGVSFVLRIITPSRAVCVQRDLHRPCWTAGAEYIDQWFDEFQAMRGSHPAWCLDTSEETVEETVARHFHALLVEP